MALTNRKLHELRQRRVGPAGNRLADAIELSGEPATALAAATKFTSQYISDVVRGRWDTITVENARKFSEYFGCTIEDLFPAREAVA